MAIIFDHFWQGFGIAFLPTQHQNFLRLCRHNLWRHEQRAVAKHKSSVDCHLSLSLIVRDYVVFLHLICDALIPDFFYLFVWVIAWVTLSVISIALQVLLTPNSTGYLCYHSLKVGQLLKSLFNCSYTASLSHYLLISGLAFAGTFFSPYDSS